MEHPPRDVIDWIQIVAVLAAAGFSAWTVRLMYLAARSTKSVIVFRDWKTDAENGLLTIRGTADVHAFASSFMPSLLSVCVSYGTTNITGLKPTGPIVDRAFDSPWQIYLTFTIPLTPELQLEVDEITLRIEMKMRDGGKAKDVVRIPLQWKGR